MSISEFYSQEASPFVADEALADMKRAAEAVAANSFAYREGVRAGTREYVMRRFPYTLICRVTDDAFIIVRIMHQAAKYFN